MLIDRGRWAPWAVGRRPWAVGALGVRRFRALDELIIPAEAGKLG